MHLRLCSTSSTSSNPKQARNYFWEMRLSEHLLH
jgi:hypothetical protein